MEAVIRDERNKLVEFLDDAPIGFYSVDCGRTVSVRQPDAGGMARLDARPRSSAATPGCTIFSPSRRRRTPLPWDPFGGRDDGGQRGEVAFKSRDRPHRCRPGSSQSTVGSGAELRTRSVVRDLTPEREWESALRLSRERFQRFFANAPVGIALIDRSGRLEEANRALGELFGAPPQALIGQTLIGFVAEEDRRELAVKLAQRPRVGRRRGRSRCGSTDRASAAASSS